MSAPRPNILLLFPDQWRADWLGCANLPGLSTPHLDGLAARGTYFPAAFTPAPLCAPARACLATARDYAGCGVSDNRTALPLEARTFYQQMRDTGYTTATCGKLDLDKPGQQWGRDGQSGLARWGFTAGSDAEGKMDGSGSHARHGEPRGPYLAHLAALGLADTHLREHAAFADWKRAAYVTALPDEAYCDTWIAREAQALLAGFAPGAPWFLQVNFAGPHAPFDVTASMAARTADRDLPAPAGPAPADPTDHVTVRRHYAAMIEHIDSLIGQLLAAVAARGELERTLVFFSSDHGEVLGDHGLWGKETWHDAAVRIPLLVAGPGVARGCTNPGLVALQDIAATALDFARCPALPGAEAHSLRAALGGGATTSRDSVSIGLRNWRLRVGRDEQVLSFARS
jgi:arylsulfatase